MRNFTLPESVRLVVEFFDMFDYPVTLYEVVKYAPSQLSFTQAHELLVAHGDIVCHDGYYGKKESKAHVVKRLRRQRLFEDKIRKVASTLRLISWCPSIVNVYLSNSMSFGTVHEDSDIDVFIVTKPRQLWSARLWAMLATMLCGTRVTATSKDKVCLSFFATTDARLSDAFESSEDYYMYFWEKSLISLQDPTIAGFISYKSHPTAHFLLSWYGFGEVLYKSAQRFLMRPQKLEMARSGGTHVIMNETMIKLHERDLRSDYNHQLQKRLYA